jgi:hypothetical protein
MRLQPADSMWLNEPREPFRKELIWEQWAGVSTQCHLSRRYVRAPHIGAIPKEGTRSQTILQLPQKSGVATADACELRCSRDSSGRCHSLLQEVSHLKPVEGEPAGSSRWVYFKLIREPR